MKINVKYLKHLVLFSQNLMKAKLSLKRFENGLYTSTQRKVPYISQFAQVTKEKDIKKIAIEPEAILLQGYPDKESFDFWCSRVCGIACIKMALESTARALDKTMWDLIKEGLELDGYKLNDKNGNFVDLGWFHRPLLALAQKPGMHGYLRQSISVYNVAQEVLNGNFVIASVKVPGRSYLEDDGTYFKQDYTGDIYGHLVLITAVKVERGEPMYFLAHNPTGYKKYEEDSVIDSKTFKRIFNGRVIVLRAS